MRLGTKISTVVGAAVLAVGLAHPTTASAQSYNPGDESKVHALTNATRTAKGLAPLARHDALVGMARRQADRMEAKGTIFHNSNLGGEITSLGVSWSRVGENVGMGPNVDLIYDALLKSPKHYENIVRSEYNTLGMGVVNGDDGKRYLVQVFANIDGATASAPKPAAPAPAPAAPAPATAPAVAQAPAPAPAAPAQVASEPAETPQPPAPSADPNALTGGFVAEFRLPPL